MKEQGWLNVLEIGVGDLSQIGEKFVELRGQLVDLRWAEVDPNHFAGHFSDSLFRHACFYGHCLSPLDDLNAIVATGQ